jgi:DNA-binding response OmpR family regulator
MQTNIARAADYDQPRAVGQALTRWRYVPIIAVTRLDNPQVRADLLNAGADAIAAKPINAPELRAMVYAAARTRRQYQNLMREGS